MSYIRSLQRIFVLLCIFAFTLFSKGLFLVRNGMTDIGDLQSQTVATPPRVIILLIDGLRGDFMERMNFYNQRMHQEPQKCVNFLFIADSPTATSLRLQAINNGNIPPFIDFTKSFTADEMEEDNVIQQLFLAGKTMYFAGDDTWTRMFPKFFNKSEPRDSFNVNDLDTVDNTVIRFFKDQIHNPDWDVMIGHVLGLDHAGHTYDVNKHRYQEKLDLYSDLLEQTYKMADDNTAIIVLGDHGVRPQGGHGGGGIEEITSYLFATYKGDMKFARKLTKLLKEEAKSTKLGNKFYEDSFEYNSHVIQREKYLRKVRQIDFAPTLAYLTGVKLPFSSLGMIIPEFTLYEDEIDVAQVFSSQLRVTRQILNYLTKFQDDTKKFGSDQISDWENSYDQFKEIENNEEQSVESLAELMGLQTNIQTITQSVVDKSESNGCVQLAMGSFVIILFLGLQIIRYSYSTMKACASGKEILQTDRILSTKYFMTGFLLAILLLYLNFNTILVLGIYVLSGSLIVILQKKINYYAFKDDRSTIPKREKIGQYLSIIFWVKTIVDRQWIQLSTYYQSREDEMLFNIFAKNLIYFKLIEYIIGLIQNKKRQKGKFHWAIISIASLFIAQQYDYQPATPEFETSSWLIPQLQTQLKGKFTVLLLPFIGLHLILRDFTNYVQKFESLNARRIFYFLHGNLLLIQLYIAIAFIYPDSSDGYVIDVLAPRIVYLSLICSAIHAYRSQRLTGSVYVGFYATFLIIFLNSWTGQVLVLYYIICIYCLWKTLGMNFKDQIKMSCCYPQYFIGCLCLLQSLFWFKLGNRPFFATVKIDVGYLGFPEFNIIITGTLVVLASLSFYLITVLSMPLFSNIVILKLRKSQGLLKDKFEYHKFMGDFSVATNITYLIPMLVQCAIMAINCYFNTDNVLLQPIFLPKYVFDTLEFLLAAAISIF